MSGLLVVVAGPSGVGKGTVLDRVLDEVDESEKSVSVTTRRPRPGEVDGEHYHFVDDEDFADLVDRDAFLEHAVYAGESYGTLVDAVDDRCEAGAVVVLEIEVQGAAQVARRAPGALRIFLAPPSRDELRRRLRDRGTESDDQVRRRMARADVELAAADDFDHVVVNDDPGRAAAEVVARIRAAQAAGSHASDGDPTGRAGGASTAATSPAAGRRHDGRA